MTTPRLAFSLCLAASLGACGGGSGSSGETGDAGPAAGGLSDSTAYSTAAAASLASADESAAVTTHSINVGGAEIAYTASAGHLTARAPLTDALEATMFYVAYTVPNRSGESRPIIYFYNGGPGSASVWLHLGSFGPRRLVTHDPSTTVPQPFELVDNAESLIDVANLVFVDAVAY
jgi:carboxypeptidase C (cathepsin A)